MAVGTTFALLPALSVSFAESTRGVGLFMAATVLVIAVFATLDRSAFRVVNGPSAAVLGYLVLAGAGVVSYLIHPSGPGTILTFAMVISIGIMISVASYSVDEIRRFVAAPLLATTAVQAAIVVVQTLTESAFGYTMLYPGRSILITNGDIVRPQGTYDHVYVAATVALLAIAIGLAVLPTDPRRRIWFLAGIAAATSTVAMTHSRSALVGLVLVFAVAGISSLKRSKGLRVGVMVVAVAFTVPALATAQGWVARFDDSINSSVDDASLGRITLAKQAIDLAQDHPVIGVGPNRYMDVLEDRDEVDQRFPYVVHNVSLMTAAELGIPAAIAITVLFSYAGVQAWRAGPRAFLLYMAIIPLLVLDVVFYNRPLGLLLLATWSGLLGSLGNDASAQRTAVTQLTGEVAPSRWGPVP